MQVIVDKHTVTIIKNEIVNEGEYNVQSCNFQFSSDYDGLPKIAIFKTGTVTKQIMLSGNTCITPEEVLQTTGIVGLGVYAYQTDGDNIILRYSPTPAVFTVEPGSYDEGDTPTPPTPSVIEQLQEEITQNANNITSLENVTDTHTSQIETIQGDITNINLEQATQNTNIQKNADDISDIKTEQTTQNNKIAQNTSDIATLNNNLTNYSLITETGSQIVLNVNPSNYQMTAILKDKNGNTIYTSNVIDLPIESMIVNVTYDSTTKEIVFTLQNGTTLRVSVADLVSGLVSTDELNTILASYYTKTEIGNLLSGKVDTTTYTQGQATQDANIEENASNIDWLQTLVNQMPHVSGQGTDLSLENVLNYRLMKFLPQGVSSQESTTGKNLLNSITDTTTRNGITFTKNSDGTYTLNGTSTSDIDFNIASDVPLDLNTSYILSGSPNTASNTTYRIMGACTRENDSTTYIADNDGSGVSIPSSKKIRVYINVKNGKTLNNVIFKPMIRLESITDDTYEPYTGGVPAPNPSYPYPVKSVAGENSLVLQNENLFSSTWEQGTINSTTGANSGSNVQIRTKNYVYVTPNQNYTFKRSIVGGYVNLRCYDNNKNYIGTGTDGANLIQGNTLAQPMGNNDYSCTLSFKENVRYVRLIDSTNDLTTQYTMVKGDTPLTSYVANQSQIYQLSLGNIELNSSPDETIRDYIYGTPDNWKKKQFIQKIILNGSESYGKNASGTGFISFTLSNYINFIDKSVSSNLRSNMLKGISSGNVSNTCRIASSGRIVLTFSDTFCDYDLTALSTTLQTMYNNNNPVILYIPLATATDIDITDTTLIGQLNNIYNNAHSYNGVTNITTTYASGNEQMYLDIEALKNVWEVTE